MLAIFWNCEIFESDISPPQMIENKQKKIAVKQHF